MCSMTTTPDDRPTTDPLEYGYDSDYDDPEEEYPR